MRIRTIKPEFWTDSKLQSITDSSKLMAIALLNYADDEGYFLAETCLIRSACRPFDDTSTSTQRTIVELSKIGYIEIFDCGENGKIGHVKNFLKHQKIDRPSDSKIKCYIDSTNTRRILDEASLPEQGTGNREKDMERKPKKIFIPPILEDVKTYFKDNGYSEQSSVRFFNYYSTAEWKDSQGKQVRNWKQKALGVWFKPENKTIIQTGISPYKPFEGYETRPPDKGI